MSEWLNIFLFGVFLLLNFLILFPQWRENETNNDPDNTVKTLMVGQYNVYPTLTFLSRLLNIKETFERWQHVRTVSAGKCYLQQGASAHIIYYL